MRVRGGGDENTRVRERGREFERASSRIRQGQFTVASTFGKAIKITHLKKKTCCKTFRVRMQLLLQVSTTLKKIYKVLTIVYVLTPDFSSLEGENNGANRLRRNSQLSSLAKATADSKVQPSFMILYIK